MNFILSQNDTSKSSDFNTRYEAVKRRVESRRKISKICSYYHCKRTSLWRWIKMYDGTKESLMLKTHRPKTAHPASCSDEFIKNILNIHRRSLNKTPLEI